jgi:hypothetical protein
MKSTPILAAAVASLLAASAADARGGARIVRPGTGNPVPRDCPLVVNFGSYGAGIDQPTLARVNTLLARDRKVTNVSRHRWGREGEVTLCVHARTAADSGRLARRIRATIPANPRGPVAVETRRR